MGILGNMIDAGLGAGLQTGGKMFADLVDFWRNTPGQPESIQAYTARKKDAADAKFRAIKDANK